MACKGWKATQTARPTAGREHNRHRQVTDFQAGMQQRGPSCAARLQPCTYFATAQRPLTFSRC